MKKNQSKRNNKYLLFSLGVGFVTALTFTITILIGIQYYQKQKTQQLQTALNLATENTRKILTNSNLAAFSVGLTIDPLADTIKNFDYVAKEIMDRHPYLYGVQILKGGEIQYVYPYEEHKDVIGYDILKNPETKLEAEKAINDKKIYYAGPLELKQGGLGIVGRLPIFHESEFWGFSAILIKIEDLLKASGITKNDYTNISFQFSKINPNTNKVEYFTDYKKSKNLSLSYTFEESAWKITAVYNQEVTIYFLLALVIMLTIASSVGSGLYTYQILKKPEKLEKLLSVKTKEIEENNEYLESMVQAIPDLIFIYDKEGRYLDFHAYEQSLLYYKPKEFIGKSIFDLFDKSFASDVHEIILKAIKRNEVVDHSYSLDFKDGRKYFESRHVAINKEKVLAVVREITDKVISEQQLEKSEQKYRNLVAQASDAIFLADEKGNLLEMNQKGLELTGISTDQVNSFNLNSIIKLENANGLSLLELINQDGKALEEAILFSQGNKETAVEISCKTTFQGQIQGIIRDITVRNNYIKSIQQQNEKLKEIAWIQSHEVRAPLARLLGLTEFLINYKSLNEQEKSKILDSIKLSAEELDLIIREVVHKTEDAENIID
ncbi:MAG: hypothetical protein DSY77_01955 [Bacteroidetes bacterium]|jgi:hypothetical protein|nr:MAG: hypothetical protein DSY77_01955 [Bacteroidota bacterium]